MNPPEGGDMGRKENPLICYYDKSEYFASLLNGWIFSGKEMILPEHISNEDRRFIGETKKTGTIFRDWYRDIYKRVRGIQRMEV